MDETPQGSHPEPEAEQWGFSVASSSSSMGSIRGVIPDSGAPLRGSRSGFCWDFWKLPPPIGHLLETESEIFPPLCCSHSPRTLTNSSEVQRGNLISRHAHIGFGFSCYSTKRVGKLVLPFIVIPPPFASMGNISDCFIHGGLGSNMYIHISQRHLGEDKLDLVHLPSTENGNVFTNNVFTL